MKWLRLMTAAMLATIFLASGSFAASAGHETVTVKRGDSLYTIVRLQYPDSAESWAAITRDIIALNPGAFHNGDPASLRVGVELRMPDYATPPPARAPMRVPSEAADAPAPENREPPRLPLDVVGEIIEVRGVPTAIDINQRRRELSVASKIYRGDTLLSDTAAGARVIMNDGAELLTRAASRIVIDDYTFLESSANAGRGTITLRAGGMRYITGLIARRNPDGFRVHTPAATIGVRGTDFAAMLCEPDQCRLPDGSPLQQGTYSGVLDGGIVLRNDAGEFSVERGDILRTASRDAVPAPAAKASPLLFSRDELAMLEPELAQPMSFLQWIRAWITGTL